MKNIVLTMIALCLACVTAASQEARPPAAAVVNVPEADQRLRLATSSGIYPVTPGDAYRLTFQQGSTSTALEIQVGNDCMIQLNVFGKLNAAGMTFSQVKETVEKAVVSAYPRSMPSLSISSVGIFQVFIKGETPEARNVDAWGMSRLSEVLEGRLGPYSSIRDIQVISQNGTTRQFDLFQSRRFGLAEQDPYLKPGDTIVISPSQRTVEIAGEVRRPGKYQLLPSEKFKDMIEIFGGGLTTAAETSRVRIDRVAGKRASTLYVDISGENGSAVPLLDGDIITIPSKTAVLPVVFFEGAVASETPQAAAAAPAPRRPGCSPQSTTTVCSIASGRVRL